MYVLTDELQGSKMFLCQFAPCFVASIDQTVNVLDGRMDQILNSMCFKRGWSMIRHRGSDREVKEVTAFPGRSRQTTSSADSRYGRIKV